MDLSQVPTLETGRLWMRLFRETDVDDYAAMNADPEVTHFFGGPWDRGRSWRHLAFLIGHWQLGGAGMWALEHKETGAFVGMVGFSEPKGWPGFELAGTLARRWWGQGYASEAARAALDYAFNVWKKERVISLVNPENHASIRMVERIGERLQGRIQHFGREMLCYGIDRESYQEMGTPALVHWNRSQKRSTGQGSTGDAERPGSSRREEIQPAQPRAWEAESGRLRRNPGV